MKAKDLIAQGYLPKELPPVFSTDLLGKKYHKILKEWNIAWSNMSKEKRKKYSNSTLTPYSIPKVGFSRRSLSIPNPLHQFKLCHEIEQSWPEIERIFSRSKISYSVPIQGGKNGRAAKTKSTFKDFKRARFISTFAKPYEVKTDISKFYGSIYTHAIPWLIYTKKVAKTNRSKSEWGNRIDALLRNTNHGQSVGIPIGPDTSLIIGELVSCALDDLIQTHWGPKKSIVSFRFMDDYYIYCDSLGQAEEVFNFIQGLLTSFELNINEEKTKITKSPHLLENSWSIEMSSFSFRKRAASQLTDLERFAGIAFRLAKENPKDSVLLFSIQILTSLKVFKENWDYYESLLLKMALTEPRVLPVINNILIKNESKLNRKKVRSTLMLILSTHIPKGNHFEVSWALWMCRVFKHRVNKSIAEKLFQSSDSISKLLGLDLLSQELIVASIDTSTLISELTEDSLSQESWIFTYEAINQGWLSPVSDPIKDHEFFSILRSHNISFYSVPITSEVSKTALNYTGVGSYGT